MPLKRRHSHPVLTGEDRARKHLSMSQEVGPHQTPNIAGGLILNFSVSKTVGNKFVVYKLPSLWYSITAVQTA